MRKDIIGLKQKFNQFKRTVKDDLTEIKWNIKRLFKKLGHKYTERVSSPSSGTSSEDSDHHDNTPDSGDDPIHGNNSGKGKRPMTRSSFKKTSVLSNFI